MRGHPLRATLVLASAVSAISLTAYASGLERFSQFINGTQSAAGEFEQKIFDKSGRIVQESAGTLAFSRPGKFRWTYVKPYAQLLVGDGSRVWIFDPDLKQVTVKKMDQALGSTPAALLAGNNEAVRALRLLPAQSETRCVAIPLLAPQRGGCDRRMISGGRAMTDLFDAAKPAAPLAAAPRPQTPDEAGGQGHPPAPAP